MFIDRAHWERHIEGYTVYDCTIMDGERLFFVLVEDTGSPYRDPLPRTRFLFARTNRSLGADRFVCGEVGSFGFTEIAYGPAAVEFVAVDTSRHVYRYDRSDTSLEKDIPGDVPGTQLRATTIRIVRVGQRLYVVGWPRRVYARHSADRWFALNGGLPSPRRLASERHEDQVEVETHYTFHDLAGFSERDMYVVGDAGEVWQFDGARWERSAFPTNQRLCTVACDGGENVYVTTQTGSVWVGRGNVWKLVVDAERSVPFRDTVWFADRLWCGSDYGLWSVEGGEFTRAHVPADVFLASGRVDVSPDGKYLLTAGPRGAALFDGKRWDVLFSSHGFE